MNKSWENLANAKNISNIIICQNIKAAICRNKMHVLLFTIQIEVLYAEDANISRDKKKKDDGSH